MAAKQIEITETDEAGNVTATYVQSTPNQQGLSRIDVILPTKTKSLWQQGLDVFLPAGYPHSVTSDYMEYQIYDSLQAFSSSIASLLSSRAVLSSVGVGDSTASPTAALLLSILQDSAGRIATILFAHRFGSSLEPECKMYRLLADILNDLAFVLDCLSPVFPKPIRVVVLSISSVLRALCGVAAGSAKASLSAHFAKWGNLGELNAKDSSQETVISLLGMIAGSLVVSWVTGPLATWTTLIFLLSVHLETNRRAVRAVSMRTLNRQRAALVYYHLKRNHVPTPEEVSREERIFERDGVLRSSSGQVLGFCNVGASLSSLFNSMGPLHKKTKSSQIDSSLLDRILALYKTEEFIMWCSQQGYHPSFDIVIKKSAPPTSILVACWQTLALANDLHDEKSMAKLDRQGISSKASDEIFEALRISLSTATRLFATYEHELRKVGWDLDAGALETSAATRVML